MEVEIKTEFIKLNQLIKYAGVLASGGEASMVILDGLVRVNGETCREKGKKIRNGDRVTINLDEEIVLEVKNEI